VGMRIETIHVWPSGFWGRTLTGGLLHWSRYARSGQRTPGGFAVASCGARLRPASLRRQGNGDKCKRCLKLMRG
jgi:hypothetical protein